MNRTVRYRYARGSSIHESDEYLNTQHLPAPRQGADRCESGCDRRLCAASSDAAVSGRQRDCTARERPVFLGPETAWPGEGWWHAYQDPQLDALIEEAFNGSPDLDLAQARLAAASGAAQIAGATRLPEVTGDVLLNESKQSYNYLIPSQALPHGWHDYGLATLNLSWELDFWGKNRSALAASMSEQRAAEIEIAQTRLILSTSVASAYAGLVDLYTLRDNAAETLALREKTVALFRQRHEFGLETLASVRQVEARRAAAQGELLALDERINLQSNAIAALMGAGPDRGWPLRVRQPSSLVHRPCRRIWRWT